MPDNTQMEQGHLYRHEDPTYNKGQLGKGVNIGGSVQGKSGSNLSIGGDSYAGKLKEVWSKATSAASKFKRPK